MEHNGTGNDPGNGSESEDASDPDVHTASLSLDAILHLLANHQRRDLLGALVDASGQNCSIADCVGHLLEREEERSGERPDHDQVEATLHHVHIPKMADAGVLEYDERSQEIRYWGHDRLEDWFDRIQDEELNRD